MTRLQAEQNFRRVRLVRAFCGDRLIDFLVPVE